MNLLLYWIGQLGLSVCALGDDLYVPDPISLCARPGVRCSFVGICTIYGIKSLNHRYRWVGTRAYRTRVGYAIYTHLFDDFITRPNRRHCGHTRHCRIVPARRPAHLLYTT